MAADDAIDEIVVLKQFVIAVDATDEARNLLWPRNDTV